MRIWIIGIACALLPGCEAVHYVDAIPVPILTRPYQVDVSTSLNTNAQLAVQGDVSLPLGLALFGSHEFRFPGQRTQWLDEAALGYYFPIASSYGSIYAGIGRGWTFIGVDTSLGPNQFTHISGAENRFRKYFLQACYYHISQDLEPPYESAPIQLEALPTGFVNGFVARLEYLDLFESQIQSFASASTSDSLSYDTDVNPRRAWMLDLAIYNEAGWSWVRFYTQVLLRFNLYGADIPEFPIVFTLGLKLRFDP